MPKFKKREQGNYFCELHFLNVLSKYATGTFVKVYVTKNAHYCDACGIYRPAQYRVILP